MKKIPLFISGIILGSLLSTCVSVGASNSLNALMSKTALYVNGEKANLSTTPINVNGKLYLPVRDTAYALGYDVGKVTSQSVELNSADNSTPLSNQNSNTTNSSVKANSSNKVEGLESIYTKGDKLDSKKILDDINSGKLTINSQDASTGDSLFHLVIRKDDYATYLIIKKNGLNVNATNMKGQSPVHEAAIDNNVFYLGELVNLSAKMNTKDLSGRTPFQYTKEGSNAYTSLKIYSMLPNL